MSLRAHNLACLERWLDSYADRFPGRMPPETVISSRRLAASVPLKKDAYERAEDYRKAREANATDWEKRRGQTDALLLYLTGKYLRDLSKTAKPEDRARYHLMHSAMRQVCLNEMAAGGHIALRRLEESGRAGNAKAGAVAKFARAAFNEVLDELQRRGFRLEVEEDKPRKGRYAEGWAKRRETTGQPEFYRELARHRRALTLSGMGSRQADKKVAEINGCGEATVRRAVKWVRENS